MTTRSATSTEEVAGSTAGHGHDATSRPRTAQLLMRVCLLSAALLLAATVVSVVAGWPAQFGGAGHPDAVATEFLTRGTALSPPLLPLVLFVAMALLSPRRGVTGVTATVVLMLLGVVFVIGGVGEAAAPATPYVPAVALTASGSAAVLLGLAVLALGGLALRERVRGDVRPR